MLEALKNLEKNEVMVKSSMSSQVLSPYFI